MKCSYDCKRMCVELYREGWRPETPEGLKERNFRCRVRKLVRMEEACGPEVLQHKEQNKCLPCRLRETFGVWDIISRGWYGGQDAGRFDAYDTAYGAEVFGREHGYH